MQWEHPSKLHLHHRLMNAFEFDGVNLPTEELRAAAEAELGEIPGHRFQAVDAMRSRLLDLPLASRPCDVSDAAILRFLRARKFDVDRATNLAVNLNAFENKYKQRFFNRNPSMLERFEAIAECGAISVLAKPAVDGHRVVCLRLALLPVDTMSADELATFAFWTMERLTWDPAVQVHGICCLSDYSDMTLRQFSQIWSLIPLSTRAEYSNCFAARYGPIRIYHAPAFVVAMWRLLRALLPTKVVSRVQFLHTYDVAAVDFMAPEDVPAPFNPAGAPCEARMREWMRLQFERSARGL